MEEQPDFCSHLGGSTGHVQRFRLVAIISVLISFWVGRPLHPHYKALASQFEPLDDVLPEGAIPFALSPSGLIPSPRFSEFSPSPALVQHLHSILPEYIPSVPHPTPDPDSETKPTTSNENATGQQPSGVFALPTIPMPAVHLNMDVRNLKWGWPGYLTFGKNSKDKEKQKNAKVAEDERKSDSELETKPDAGGERGASPDAPVVDGDVPSSDPQKVGEKVEVEAEVDTVSLVDAMESENSHGGSSNEHSPGSGTPSEIPPSPPSPPPPATRTIALLPDDDVTPTAIQPVNPVPEVQEGVKETSQPPTPTRTPSPNPVELPPEILEPNIPQVTFSQTLVHLAPLGHPLQTIKRRLYYLTVRHPSYAHFPQGLTGSVFG